MDPPRPLFVYFRLFQTNITILTTNKHEKYPSSARSWDSNSRPTEHESPLINTRSGLPPPKNFLELSKKVSGDHGNVKQLRT